MQEAASVTRKVDALMQDLYRCSAGGMHQTLVADYSVADAYRAWLEGRAAPNRRLLTRLAGGLWRGLTIIAGRRGAFRLSVLFWSLAGCLALPSRALNLHQDTWAWEGKSGAQVLVLRTGVANETLIAAWAAKRHGADVALLKRRDRVARRVSGLRLLPRLVATYVRLNSGAARCILTFEAHAAIAPEAFAALVPFWLALLFRRSLDIVQAHHWALRFLAPQSPAHIYVTMNYAIENAFLHALPGTSFAYVEHGFPRRGIPPLSCRQFVYTQLHADYLKSFAPELEAEIIGLAYFPATPVTPTRTIVIASLQDWPAFRIAAVADRFNRALGLAREAGWRLVFRTRHYGGDAFAAALDGPWDEISDAAKESFAECLTRTRPAMVWTTWSTAILDAKARGIDAVAFVTQDLNDHFVVDLVPFALCSTGGADEEHRIAQKLLAPPSEQKSATISA